MTSGLTSRARLGFALVGVAISAMGLVASVAAALPPNTPPTNGLTGLQLSPSSGTSGTTFEMRFNPINQACPGNNNTGWAWSTFVTPVAQDPALLTFENDGYPKGAARTAALRNASEELVMSVFPDLDTFQITPPPPLSWSATFNTGAFNLPAGSYYVGIACWKAGQLTNEKYWATKVNVTASPGSGPLGFTWAVDTTPPPTTLPPTTTAAPTTLPPTTTAAPTTTAPGVATTTVPAGGAPTTTVAAGAAQAATLNPLVPTAGASYKVTHPNCRVGDTITVTQPQSTPTSATATCAIPVAGLVRPEQAAPLGTATVTFTAAPTAPGTYTVTSTGATSGTRTTTFTIVGAAPPNAAPTTVASTGGSPSGGSIGSIPATGSSTTSVIVWGILLLVFGRMAILFGRKPKVISANR